MIALITTVLGIIAVILELWVQNKPQRVQEETDEQIQSGRGDIAAGNVGAIAIRIDGLLADQTGPADNPAGLESAEDVERRISQL